MKELLINVLNGYAKPVNTNHIMVSLNNRYGKIATRVAVKKALARLCDEKRITRVERGVYESPRVAS